MRRSTLPLVAVLALGLPGMASAQTPAATTTPPATTSFLGNLAQQLPPDLVPLLEQAAGSLLAQSSALKTEVDGLRSLAAVDSGALMQALQAGMQALDAQGVPKSGILAAIQGVGNLVIGAATQPGSAAPGATAAAAAGTTTGTTAQSNVPWWQSLLMDLVQGAGEALGNYVDRKLGSVQTTLGSIASTLGNQFPAQSGTISNVLLSAVNAGLHGLGNGLSGTTATTTPAAPTVTLPTAVSPVTGTVTPVVNVPLGGNP